MFKKSWRNHQRFWQANRCYLFQNELHYYLNTLTNKEHWFSSGMIGLNLYQVSTKGNIKNKHGKLLNFTNLFKHCNINQKTPAWSFSRNNKLYYMSISKFILLTLDLLPYKQDPALHCYHINGNKAYNKLNNLQWYTRQEIGKYCKKDFKDVEVILHDKVKNKHLQFKVINDAWIYVNKSMNLHYAKNTVYLWCQKQRNCDLLHIRFKNEEKYKKEDKYKYNVKPVGFDETWK